MISKISKNEFTEKIKIKIFMKIKENIFSKINQSYFYYRKNMKNIV